SEDFVHSAKLGVEHVLDLLVVEAGQNSLGPAGEFRLDIQRRLVAGEAIRVAQAGERLVQRVPWRPLAVEVECGGLDLALRERVEALPAAFERAEIAVAVLVLHDLELRDDVIDAILESPVASRRPHGAGRGEIVTRDVAREISAAAVPSTIRLCPWREAGVLAVVRQHTIRLQLDQVPDVGVLRLFERATEQADAAEREGPGGEYLALRRERVAHR